LKASPILTLSCRRPYQSDLRTDIQDEICDEQGRIDITLPTTKKLLRVQIDEIFQRFPGLDELLAGLEKSISTILDPDLTEPEIFAKLWAIYSVVW
jgi:hypothetical protein